MIEERSSGRALGDDGVPASIRPFESAPFAAPALPRSTRFGFALAISLLLSACSASGPRYRPIDAPPGGAVINVYRPDRFPGSANVYHLTANGKHIAEVSNGGYCAYRTEPGNVSFATTLRPGIGTILPALLMEAQELITIPAEAGEVYYVRFDVMGPSMELVPPDVGAVEIKELNEFDLVKADAGS